jgi:outer membrane protein assembly factor BamB
MYRHDPRRSNATSAAAPQKLDVLWQKSLTPPRAEGLIETDWTERLCDPLTAPVVAEGTLVAAATDRNQVIALDAATGSELWRQTVGGRVDSSPTIYQDLCLFGSHDGYLYALARADGRLAWKLRAAPRDDRLVSYGKVESVWPVVGTVLVTDGLAYASAGRTQGSDGGIVVRAVDPHSGKIAWSKAVVAIPDTLDERELKKGEQAALMHELRKNDLMLDTGDTIQLMLTRMNPKTGEIVPNARREFHNQAKKTVRGAKSKQSKARADGGGKPAEPAKPVAPDEIVPGIGLEGFLSGIWTRLGDRRYGRMNFGNASGSLVSWDDAIVCADAPNGDAIQSVRRDKLRASGKEIDPQGNLWKTSLPDGYQATAVIVCRNAIVVGGGVYTPGSKQGKGFVLLLAMEGGKPTAECRFDVPLAYNGIAVTEGRLYATLANGPVACLGAK